MASRNSSTLPLHETVARHDAQIGQLTSAVNGLVESVDKGFKEVREEIKGISTGDSARQQAEKSNKIQLAGVVLAFILFLIGGFTYGLNRENQFQDALANERDKHNNEVRHVLRTGIQTQLDAASTDVKNLLSRINTAESELRHVGQRALWSKADSEQRDDFLLNEIAKAVEAATGKPYQFHSIPSRVPDKASDNTSSEAEQRR
jgi:hypothetical protein